MPNPVVHFHEVSKQFGFGPRVIERLSFGVQAGEFVSLIGPSGCGKSTLLRMIAGLTPVSTGTLEVEGTTAEAASSHLGFVFQEPTLLPWLTVSQNIELPQRFRATTAADRAAERKRVLRLVRLEDKAEAYPRELSGGQKMRVSLARALTLAPRILLLDEPFGALDEMTREHLNEELLAIRTQQAWTAFFVTHSVAEAVFLSDRVIVLAPNPGRIHAELPISLPQPRTGELRLSRKFHDTVAQVSRTLREIDPAAR